MTQEIRKEIKERLKDFEANVEFDWEEYLIHIKEEYIEDSVGNYGIGLYLSEEEEEYFKKEIKEIFNWKI